MVQISVFDPRLSARLPPGAQAGAHHRRPGGGGGDRAKPSGRGVAVPAENGDGWVNQAVSWTDMSDLMIAVPNRDLAEFCRRNHHGRDADLVTPKFLNPRIRKRVGQEALVQYERRMT